MAALTKPIKWILELKDSNALVTTPRKFYVADDVEPTEDGRLAQRYDSIDEALEDAVRVNGDWALPHGRSHVAYFTPVHIDRY